MVHRHSKAEVVSCLTGMVFVFVLAFTALLKGHDGIVVTSACTVIGVLVGYLCGGSPKPKSTTTASLVAQSNHPENPHQKAARRVWHFGRCTWEKG